MQFSLRGGGNVIFMAQSDSLIFPCLAFMNVTYITMIEMTEMAAGAKLSEHTQLKAYTQFTHSAVTLVQ